MKTRFLIWSFLSLFAGALALLSGCDSSTAVAPAGLWSCFDTGSGIGCVKQAALSTADVDVNGDGVPDHFVCADDDADNHDRSRDQDRNGQSGQVLSGNDADHDGIDDDLDCGARAACHDLTDDDNADRHEVGEVEHGGGDGGHHGDDGPEMHGEGDCTPPSL